MYIAPHDEEVVTLPPRQPSSDDDATRSAEPAEAERGESRWRPFVVAQGFGHLVAGGRDRDVAVVVPTQYVLDGDEVLIHVARPNPVLDALAEHPKAVLSIAGDWAYIPSSWKAIGDEDPALGIPTTYYAAVQIVGTATVLDDPADVAALLRRQLATIQPAEHVIDPADHGTKLRAIRGIRLSIDDVRAKFKYGGNVDVAHRAEVARRLAERAGPGDAAALARIRVSE